jgi:hypothetical protein
MGHDPLTDELYAAIQRQQMMQAGAAGMAGNGDVNALLTGGGGGAATKSSGTTIMGISIDELKTSMRKPIVVAIIVFIVINPYTLSFAQHLLPSLFSDERMSIMQMRTLFLAFVVAFILFFSSLLSS